MVYALMACNCMTTILTSLRKEFWVFSRDINDTRVPDMRLGKDYLQKTEARGRITSAQGSRHFTMSEFLAFIEHM